MPIWSENLLQSLAILEVNLSLGLYNTPQLCKQI